MRYIKALFILLVLLLLPFTLKLRGEEYGQNQSLFTDIKAHKDDDILTVLIYEQNRASQKVETKTEKTTKFSTKGGLVIGLDGTERRHTIPAHERWSVTTACRRLRKREHISTKVIDRLTSLHRTPPSREAKVRTENIR